MLSAGLLPWWVVHLATAALLFAALRRSALRPSRTAAAALLALSLLLPLAAAPRGGVLAPLESLYTAQPWRSMSAELGVEPPGRPIFTDVWAQMLPWQAVVREAWSAGEWPLWNPYVLGGSPLAGAFSPAPYWPPHLLALLVPPARAPTLVAALELLLAALSAFLFLRDRDCGEGGALVGASAWCLCTFQLFWLGWPQSSVASVVPLVLLFAGRLARAPRPGALLGLAGALALATFAGHAETLLHATLLAVAYFLWSWRRAADRGRWRGRVLAGLGAGALAAGIAAVFLLPFLSDLGETRMLAARSELRENPPSGIPPRLSAQGALAQLVPFRFGVYGEFEPAGPKPHESFSTAYVGSAALALAAMGLLAAGRPERWFFAATALVGIAAGCSFRPLIVALRALPVLGLAVNQRLVFAAAFALSALAAFGWEEAWSPRRGAAARSRRLRLGVGATAAAAGLVALVAPTLLAAGMPRQLLARETALHVGAVAALALLLALPRRAPWVALAAVAVIAAARYGEAGRWHRGVPESWYYPRPPILDALPPGSPGGRFTALGAILRPNTGSVLGLEDARGYDPMALGRLHATFPLWCDGPWVGCPALRDLRRPFLSFLGARWALAPADSGRASGWRTLARREGLVLLENPGALPLAFLPERIHAASGGAETLEEMARCGDFAAEAWLETPDGAPPSAPGRRPGDRVESIEREGLSRYRIATRLSEPAWVVTSIAAWPGWRARSGERELRTGIANHAFVAFEAPAGARRIELAYRPRAFLAGRAISALALSLFAVLAALAGAPRERLRPEPDG